MPLFTSTTTGRVWKLLFTTLVWLVFLPSSHAYRMGDAVDAEIVTPKGSSVEVTLKRGQMPLFGTDTTAKIALDSASLSRFSVSLEEGFRSLPLIPMLKAGKSGGSLDLLEIFFVFSRSSGEIHALQHIASYRQEGARSSEAGEITIRYKWVEEESVDLNSGAFVMFLAVFIVSLFFLIDLCGLCSDGDDEYVPYNPNDSYGFVQDSSDPMSTMSGVRMTGGGGGAAKYE